MNPRISVIIPNYNRAPVISRALDSVLSQTLPATEIIVVDDGSTDQSVSFLRKTYPHIRLLQQQHRGVSAARNLGIKVASGDWLALLDSDDAWQPAKLEQQSKALMAHNDYKVIHTNETWIRNGKEINQLKKHRKYGGYIFQKCLPICAMSPSSVMFHQDVIEEVGLFNEKLPVCEDYDMWLRICCRFPVLFLDQALVIKYGGHGDQLSRQYWGMDRFRIQALAGILATDYLTEDDRNAAIKIMLEKISIYMKGARKHGNNYFVDEFLLLEQRYQPDKDINCIDLQREKAQFK